MSEQPFVSVVMPIRNEAATIERTIESVLRQDYPASRMEILVADGRSDDGTPDVLRRAAERFGRGSSVIVLDNDGRIVPSGLNLALSVARGDVIVRVDGHCEIEPDYVRRCVDALVETGADNVGGRQRAIATTWIGRAIAAATSSRFGVGNARFHYADRPGWVDTVYLGAYRREVFDRIGGFDEELVRNQDDELNLRLTQNGGKIWLDPEIRSVYRPRTSLRAFWRQYFQYGYYKVLVMRKRRGMASPRALVPPAFVGSIAGALALGLATGWWLPLILVAAPYAIATAGASMIVGRDDRRIVPVLPLIFAVMHTAYGTGFLCGVLRWGSVRAASA